MAKTVEDFVKQNIIDVREEHPDVRSSSVITMGNTIHISVTLKNGRTFTMDIEPELVDDDKSVADS